jgi:hypothetical protein
MKAENGLDGGVFRGQDRIELLSDALKPAERPIVRKREVKPGIAKLDRFEAEQPP